MARCSDVAEAAGGDQLMGISVYRGRGQAQGQLQFAAGDGAALTGQFDDAVEMLLVLTLETEGA